MLPARVTDLHSTSRATSELPTLLDDVTPDYDVSSRHTIWVAASPSQVYRAAREADLGRPAVVRILMGLRVAPAWLAAVLRRRPPAFSARGKHSVGAAKFTLIAELPGEEFVLGIMGRFWTPSGGVVATTAEQFRQPPPAGLAQAAWNFRVLASGSGTQLSTETRVRCGDAATRRQFGRYWRVIRLGSGWIRRSMLRQIRTVAERRADEEPVHSGG